VDFDMTSRIREYIKLIRPYGILFIGLTPVFGALCNGLFDSVSLFMLLIIGVLGHIFVFVQNDYLDFEVDRQSRYVMKRPLLSGVISHRGARLLFLGAFFLSLLLTCIFFFSVSCLLLLLLAFLFMTLYNWFSKRKPLMEYVLGIAVFFYGLFGACVASESISVFALIISCVGFLQWVFSVGVSANLKDVEYDTKLGIRTTPVIFGTKAIGNELKKPVSFVLYTYGIKLLHLSVVALPFVFGFSSPFVFGYPFPLIGYLCTAGLLLFTIRQILLLPIDKRNQMLRYEGFHEGLALLLIPFVLFSYLVTQVGLFLPLLLILFLILWPLCCLRILYGKNLIPLE
jgi:4-hydroxybenzoate polyprenyltransferase